MCSEPPPKYGRAFLSLQFGELLVGGILELQSPSKLVMSYLARLVGLLLGIKLKTHKTMHNK
jgi:hypothetical protein